MIYKKIIISKEYVGDALGYSIKKFLKNCFMSIFSNTISLFVSISIILIVPRFIGVNAYGYWQLYLFYSSFVGLFHFGWLDGLYLKHAGMSYAQLNKDNFSMQFVLLNSMAFVISISLYILTAYFVSDIERSFIVFMVIMEIVIVIPKIFLVYILLSVSFIPQYTRVVLLERVLLLVLIWGCLCIGYTGYHPMIIADLISKSGALLLSIYYCRAVLAAKVTFFRSIVPEIKENIVIGSRLLFANISGMLILGIVRFGVEQHWDISTFGKVSIALSIANLCMVFINAINIVLFPLLRRANHKQLEMVYPGFNLCLTWVGLGFLGLYYPAVYFISYWLPTYGDSCVYMAVLFPLCVYEGKWSMLVSSYLKSLRKEGWIFKINVVAVVISCFMTLAALFLLDDVFAAVISIPILLASRCFVAEFLLTKILHIHVLRGISIAAFFSAWFAFSAYYFPLNLAMSIYLGAYLSYILCNRRDLFDKMRLIKKFIQNG